MQNSIERRKLAMKRNTKSERNVKTLGAVTHTHTHTQVTINEIKKYISGDRKVFCCFCDMQKW